MKTTLRPWLLVALLATGCGHGLQLGPLQVRWAPEPDAVAVAVPPQWAASSDVPHVSVFYDALAPYGLWMEDAELGWVWSPSDAGFAPYSRGLWVETEAGPTFIADEPFGWAVAHYGRWFFRERWLWVPGTQWGPAWVEWRVGDGFIGWAALGPEGRARPGKDNAWRFVATADFWVPGGVSRAYAQRHVPWLLARSRPHGQWGQLGPAGRGENGDQARHETSGVRAKGFVVGPEVRYSGWRGRRVPLGGLPQGQIRWLPRWERPVALQRPSVRSIRAGPAGAERFGRKAPARAREVDPRRAPGPKPRPQVRLRPR